MIGKWSEKPSTLTGFPMPRTGAGTDPIGNKMDEAVEILSLYLDLNG